MHDFFHKLDKKGISVLEVLAVVAILVVVLSVTTSQFYKFKENQVLKNGVQDVLSSLNKARSNSLSSLDSSVYGVRFESNQIIIFKGTTYSSGAATNEIISIVTPASISNVTLNGSSGTSGDMYFNRLSGEPSKAGTITISSPSFSKNITILATGAFSAN